MNPQHDTTTQRRTAYEARRQERIDRLRARAEAKETQAAARFASPANQTLRQPPMGQPILIGHHSAKRHRNLIKRADNDLRKGVELQAQAETLRRRAAAAESNHAISSDDPEAAGKVQERIKELEARQARMKEVNAALRKGSPIELTPEEQRELAKLVQVWGGKPRFPSYMLQNNRQNIARLKQRAAELEAAADQAGATIDGEGFRVELDVDENRIRLQFADRIPREQFQAVRRLGFVWSRRNQAFQRQLNRAGKAAATAAVQQVLGKSVTLP